MSLRQISVDQARATGVCSQCLKNKVAENRMQCQRCIDTNKRKQQRRRGVITNTLRLKVDKFCIKNGICTRCFSRPNDAPNKYCRVCLDYKLAHKQMSRKRLGLPVRSKIGRPRLKDLTVKERRTYEREKKRRQRLRQETDGKQKIGRPRLPEHLKKTPTKDQRRAWHKKHKNKKQYNKSRKLSQIRSAVEKGTKL